MDCEKTKEFLNCPGILTIIKNSKHAGPLPQGKLSHGVSFFIFRVLP
jgi:hypothetical protein